MSETLPRVMLVTDRGRLRGRDLIRQVVEAARGGVGIVQVREPGLTDDALRDLVHRIRDGVPPGTRVIVNGNLRVAATTDSGLHLPARMPEPGQLRPRPYGRSAHDVSEAGRAVDEQADYLVLGTIFPTRSKPGHPGAGPELIREISGVVAPMPVYAIGGITVSGVAAVLHAGAHGVAVCGPLMSSNDPRRLAEGLTLAVEVALDNER